MTTHKKFIVICKTNNGRVLKHTVTNLLNYHSYIKRQYAGIRYMNVYDYYTHIELARFQKNNPPNTPHITF